MISYLVYNRESLSRVPISARVGLACGEAQYIVVEDCAGKRPVVVWRGDTYVQAAEVADLLRKTYAKGVEWGVGGKS